ncbi:hypothetical protein AYR62_13655 [Secundilactobacillus paracollinoides]|nr:hypothetical protein AYR61_04350 [Secundilactobacillus paracollinoides]ANZ65019.1 hypothetical protein AYR62_13655 [Secundilactobacillus paracollinoides]KRL78808.1 hypothetical protein FC17_GL000823 [Secundilactobacillus paracollinoides DSM 15502 = JCM 11969]
MALHHLTSKAALMNDLVDPAKAKLIPSGLVATLRNVLFNSIHAIFIAALVLLVLSVVTLPLIRNSQGSESNN